MWVRQDVQNTASLGRVIVSNSAFQKKTHLHHLTDFGHLLDSIHPITSLAAALVGSKVDPVVKSCQKWTTLPETNSNFAKISDWMKFPFSGKEKAYFNRGELLAVSLRVDNMGVSKNRGTPKWMVYKGKPHSNSWFGGTSIFGNTHIFHMLSKYAAPFNPRLHSYPTFKIGKSIGLMKKKPLAKYAQINGEMGWYRSSTSGNQEWRLPSGKVT